MSNIKKNFIYNALYQILILIIPLITAPYLARVIGAEGIGIYSYTYSFAQYFVLFAMLGLNNYGNRCIAKVRDDKEKLSKEFLSIYALQFITAFVALICYIILIHFVKEYKIFAILQLVYVISAFFDINWLFFGLEKFKLTVTRNTIIKIISTISIFILVKDKNDLNAYVLILGFSTLLSQLSLWAFVKKYIKFVKINFNDIIKHIKPNLTLFVPVIAISLYNIMDKLMLGNMTNATEVGLYENAEKIVHIPVSIIGALGTVMLPRISNLVIKGNKLDINKYIDKSMKFIIFISVPTTLGLITIAENFAPIFYGLEFTKTGILIECLALIIFFKSWANVIRTQYLIPNEKDKDYISSVCIGAVVNFITNLILIQKYASVGACIGTVFAEFFVMLYQTISVRKTLDLKKYIKYFIEFILKGIIMFVIIKLFAVFITNKYLLLFLQISIGIVIYFMLNINYILSNFSNSKLLKKINKSV